MALPQQKFREIVFLLLYSHDMGRTDDDEMISFLMEELSVSKQSVLKAMERARLISDKLPEIDAQIAAKSVTYEFERIQSVERNVLRLGVYELFHDNELPPKVAIAEALRLAKKFGTPESVAFVNAILDSLFKERNE